MVVALGDLDLFLLRRQSEVTRVVAGEVLRVDELDGDEYDEGPRDIVGRVGYLMRLA